MPRGHPDLPTSPIVRLSKAKIFEQLRDIDSDLDARARVLEMESRFRNRVDAYIKAKARRGDPMTNPFVLMMHSRRMDYRRVAEVVKDIPAGAGFASMETEAGKMVEKVTFEVFGWKIVESTMQSTNTVVDAWRIDGTTLRCATLKSGPRCLNDAMAKDIGTDVAKNIALWAASNKVSAVDFNYAVIYGTPTRSNKKDWHVLRNIAETLPRGAVITNSHKKAWTLAYSASDVTISAAVRLGIDWWTHLGGPNTWVELSMAFIRACIQPSTDLGAKSEHAPSGFNVGLLQQSQLDWLILCAKHFCDELVP